VGKVGDCQGELVRVTALASLPGVVGISQSRPGSPWQADRLRGKEMGRLIPRPNFPDEPDFLGLTEAEARQLAAERALGLRLIREGDEGPWTMEINTGRVTAELEDDVIVYAQRY
jgi:hypothetical protein